MARVTLKDISKSYNGVKAVDSLSFEVRQGEFLVILGPPGAGKSSTVKIIAGVEPPSGGDVFFDDRPMGETPPNKRNVAMVFESYALYPHLTSYENIAYPLRARKGQLGYTAAQIDQHVREMADLLRISEQLERRPAFLSGGQRQRIALARSLVRDPDLLLLDEPIAHLDARLRHHLRGELKRFHQERRTTIIWCTPDYLEAIAMGDRVAVLSEGSLKQMDSPAEILNNPATVEVAQFVGDPPMNLLPARIRSDGGTLWLDFDGMQVPASGKIRRIIESTGRDVGELIIGIRPRDVLVHQAEVRPPAVPSELYVAETLHRKTVLSLSSGTGSELIKANASTEFEGEVGDKIWIELPMDKAFVFDVETGLAMTT